MNGVPKFYNTKQDYLNGLELFPEETKDALRELLGDVNKWQYVGPVEDIPVIDETHKVQEGQNGEFEQYVYGEDAYARLFLLGFTVEEVEELIGE